MFIDLGSTLCFIVFRPTFFFCVMEVIVDKDLFSVEVSRSHPDTSTTLGKNPLDECSTRPNDLYLITHNNHTREIFMRPAGFEPTIPSKREAADRSLRPGGH